MKKWSVWILAIALCAAASAAAATPVLKPVAFFDGTRGEYPESIAVDQRGNLYLSLTFLSVIRKVTPQGVQSDFAQIQDDWIQGLVFDRTGNLMVTGGKGIWKVSPRGTVSLFSEVPGRIALNDLCFDRRANLYATDDFKIWKIDPSGNATVWSEDVLFQPGQTTFPYPVGGNGLIFSRDGRTLYVSNTSAGRVLSIPVNRNGTAGKGRILAESPALIGADGLELDDDGDLYVAVNFEDGIVRVSPRGKVSTVVAGDILSSPTSLTFGKGRHADTIYICNSGDVFFSADPVGEGLLRLDEKSCRGPRE